MAPAVRRRVAVLLDGGASLSEVRLIRLDVCAVPARLARLKREWTAGRQEWEVIREREDGAGADMSGYGLPVRALGQLVVWLTACGTGELAWRVLCGSEHGAPSVALAVGCVMGRRISRPSDEAVRGYRNVLQGGDLKRDAEVGWYPLCSVGAPRGARDPVRESGARRGFKAKVLGDDDEVPRDLCGVERCDAVAFLGASRPPH